MELPADPQPLLLGGIGLVTVYFAYLLLRSDPEAPVPYHVEPPEQIRPGWKGEVLEEPSLKACVHHSLILRPNSNLKDVQVSGSKLIQCYAPATGESLGRINPSTTSGIDRAIAKAKEAQVQWAKTSFSERRKVLRTMLKFVLENQDTIARVACLDSGKTMVDASLGESLVTAEKLKWTIDHGEKALRPERRPTNLLMMYKRNEVIWEPLGVVAACVSWK